MGRKEKLMKLAGNVESNIFEMASSMAGLLYVVTVGMT